eukprot:gene9272-biopygen170
MSIPGGSDDGHRYVLLVRDVRHIRCRANVQGLREMCISAEIFLSLEDRVCSSSSAPNLPTLPHAPGVIPLERAP